MSRDAREERVGWPCATGAEWLFTSKYRMSCDEAHTMKSDDDSHKSKEPYSLLNAVHDDDPVNITATTLPCRNFRLNKRMAQAENKLLSVTQRAYRHTLEGTYLQHTSKNGPINDRCWQFRQTDVVKSQRATKVELSLMYWTHMLLLKVTLFCTNPRSMSSRQWSDILNFAFTMVLVAHLARALFPQVINAFLLTGIHFVFFFQLEMFLVGFSV
jgi:hypothetical protein